MNTDQNKNTENNVNQEIDLTILFKSIGGFFDRIGFIFYRIISFFLRNAIITIAITIMGLLLGWYFYKNDQRAYRHEVIVATNFNSTEYVYSKILNFSAEMNENSSLLKGLSGLKIEPVVDIFEFVSDEKNNLDIAKYLSENTIEVSKFKKNNNVEKLYRYHRLSYYTDTLDADKSIYNALFSELNSDTYLLERQKIERLNTEKRLKELETSIEAINQIFNKLGTSSSGGNELNIQMYAQINDLMLTKNELLKKINQSKIALLLEEEKTIFDTSKLLNIPNKSIFKIALPAVLFNFIFLFIGVTAKFFRKYRNRNLKANEKGVIKA